MGICESLDKHTKNIINSQISESICFIETSNGEMGTGFLCKIPFPDFLSLLPVLITSSKILKKEGFYFGKEIKLRLKNYRNISLKIDEKRKIYTDEKYPVTIIEIVNSDNLDINSFLEVKFNSDVKDIYLIYYRSDNEHKPYYIGEIKNTNNNRFTHSCKYIEGEIGCPIMNRHDYKVIGVNNGLDVNTGLNSGILIEQPIQNFNDFYFKSNLKFNVFFQELYGSKKYVVECEEDMMFGELIIIFCLKSGILINENISFFFNNNEIPSYSSFILNQMNIQQNSIIYFTKQNKIMTNNVINVSFRLDGIRYNIIANPNMLVKELILKYCQNIRQPYKETISNYAFLFNSENILSRNIFTLKYIGIQNCSTIEIVKVSGIIS